MASRNLLPLRTRLPSLPEGTGSQRRYRKPADARRSVSVVMPALYRADATRVAAALAGVPENRASALRGHWPLWMLRPSPA